MGFAYPLKMTRPACSIHGSGIYGIFTYIYNNFKPNVGKYTIHGAYGSLKSQENAALRDCLKLSLGLVNMMIRQMCGSYGRPLGCPRNLVKGEEVGYDLNIPHL